MWSPRAPISSKGESLFPRGVPIGQVTSTSEQNGFKSVEVSPLVDLHGLDVVQVLTYRAGSRPETLNGAAATLAPSHQLGPEEEAQGGQVAQAGGGG